MYIADPRFSLTVADGILILQKIQSITTPGVVPKLNKMLCHVYIHL